MPQGAGDTEIEQKITTSKKLCFGIQSEDRKTRKQAIIEFENFLRNGKFNNDELRDIFKETHMYTLNTLRDKVETVREQSVKLVTFLIIELLPLNDFYLTYIFPVFVERIGSVELIEESEEIRLCLLHTLIQIIEKYSNTEQLKPFLNDCIIILCETVKDKYPAIKELSCKCVVALAKALPRDFHLQSESLIKPVLTCFPHQRYKVRVEGINCIGEIVMHSSYKGVELVVVPMAEKLFDQIPAVRRAVAEVAARWLLDYRDRYSFFHKLLPLLLTGLNDEVEETREQAHILWEKVGLQYQQENEKDLKDQMDYLSAPPKYYLDHLKRPNLGCRVLVQRHIGKIAPAIANELTSWQADIRVRCSQLLCSLALHAEECLTMHLQDVLMAMFSASRDDDPRVVMNIMQASEIIGLFVPFDTWSQLLFPQLENCLHFGHIIVLRSLIKGAPKELISNSLEEITVILETDFICYSRKKRLQRELLECVKAICEKYQEKEDSKVGYHLFKILISVVALKCPENADVNISVLDDLSQTLHYKDANELWSNYSRTFLEHINVDPKSWTSVTNERCIFDIFLKESGEAFGENLLLFSEILTSALHDSVDPEGRLQTFLALTLAFENKDVILKNTKNLSKFLEDLITDVFVPALVWHAGRTAEAMRTMAATCLKAALIPTPSADLFSSGDVLRPLVDKLLPLLLSLMEDSSSQSRLLSMACLVLLKDHARVQRVWLLKDFVRVYPEIMKRLDDPTENVRRCAIETLTNFFEDCPDEFKEDTYSAHHELILDTLFTHFDDDEEHIQDLTFDVLKSVATINKDLLIKKTNRHRPLLRNQKGCDKVLAHFI